MVFICSFIVLAVIFVTFMLLVTSGCIVFSGTHKRPPLTYRAQTVINKTKPAQAKPAKPKAYIDLNGRLYELHSKKEENDAKKQNFKVVYK